MVVFPTQAIARLSERIEQAYLRRCPRVRREYAHSAVWLAAAARLANLHRNDPSIPLDAELFVASQDTPTSGIDPWRELAHPSAIIRYRCRVRRITVQLRRELRDEIRRAERRLNRGESLAVVLGSSRQDLSPLGRFLVAYRADEIELANAIAPLAREQHRACPLYRPACEGLVPSEAYPFYDVLPEWVDRGTADPRRSMMPYSMN
jgi:hypothetical protein